MIKSTSQKSKWGKGLGLFFSILYFSSSFAQITTTYDYGNSVDTILPVTSTDTIKKEVLQDQSIIDLMNIENNSIPEPYISLKKSLLDSLLKPFYTYRIDSAGLDSVIQPKYRMRIRQVNGDTLFVPLPKESEHLVTKRIYRFQPVQIEQQVNQQNVDRLQKLNAPVWWKNEDVFTLAVSEAAFINWNAGGNNSIAGLAKLSMVRKYQKLFTLWNNELFLSYGLNNTEERGLRKTEDRIQLNSTFGYRSDTISHWYYSAKFNFKTQFTDGFNYPNTDDPISRFFAPAYLFFGAGTEYNVKKEKLSVYMSPLTVKSTFVFDDKLSAEGAFGVEPGERSRVEFGIFTEASWETEVMKNVTMNNRLGLYTDYLNDFGNIDVDWAIDFKLSVNKWIKANLGGHLIYDNDIKIKEDTDGDGNLETLGPRVQFKQVFNVGLSLNF
ncbi:DUF3078 domain-containing protein [Namhaeicola litoreus]|uniref:DUF3078 domain-containing protein n=1 Tax=Namhaeicola litoreus TaxID=1052145 RepID=A0ABW3XZ56_9FLAO